MHDERTHHVLGRAENRRMYGRLSKRCEERGAEGEGTQMDADKVVMDEAKRPVLTLHPRTNDTQKWSMPIKALGESLVRREKREKREDGAMEA